MFLFVSSPASDCTIMLRRFPRLELCALVSCRRRIVWTNPAGRTDEGLLDPSGSPSQGCGGVCADQRSGHYPAKASIVSEPRSAFEHAGSRGGARNGPQQMRRRRGSRAIFRLGRPNFTGMGSWNGEIIKINSRETREGPSRQTQGRSALDVPGRSQARSRNREAVPSPGDQGRAAQAEDRSAEPLEGGHDPKSPLRAEDERRHIRRQGCFRCSQDWRQAGDRPRDLAQALGHSPDADVTLHSGTDFSPGPNKSADRTLKANADRAPRKKRSDISPPVSPP